MTLANATRLAAADVPWLDENGREVVLAIVKATFTVRPGGKLVPADEPSPVRLADEPWDEEATDSSLRYPTDVGLPRVGTDVVVLGDAVTARPQPHVDVAVQVRDRATRLRVHGERPYFTALGELRIGEARPFERMPVVYERAYGGTAPSLSVVELRNPVGVGVFDDPGELDGTAAPQIEALDRPHDGAPRDDHAPEGLGAIPPHWEPRRSLAGTFDEAWRTTRMPLPPGDRDPRCENVAHPRLIQPTPLVAGDPIRIENMSSAGPLMFAVPSVRLVVRGVFDTGRLDVRPPIDLLLIEPERARLELTWRAVFPIGRARQVLREIHIDTEVP